MPGSARSTGSSSPTAWASSAEPCSDDAIGSSVNSRCSHAPAIVSSARRLVVTFSMPSLTTCWAAAGSPLASSMASPRPRMRSRTTAGWSSRYPVATIRWVVTNCPSGQISDSSRRTLPPPSFTRRVAHGSGTQAPSSSPAWNAASVSALSCGVIATSPPPLVSVSKPCSWSHARRATSWVLPSDGVASLVPARSAGVSMPSRTTSAAPPEVVPATMRSASPPERA